MNTPSKITLSIKGALPALLMAMLFSTAPKLHAVVIVDLTGSNNAGTINGALFQFTDTQPTGTGVIQPFLRLQNSPMEEGYNTSGGTPMDDKGGPWTHDLKFSDLAATAVLINNVVYYGFLLDINEPGGSKSLISLDQLQFYTSPVGSQTGTNVAALGTLRYTFNVGDYVLMDASRNHGSGSGDMIAYVPASDFAGTAPTDFVYMYNHFGSHAEADGSSQGGFEEWALMNQTNPVPEPTTVALVAFSIAAAAASRRRLFGK